MIAAAILTGGQARRFFGQDKSRLVVPSPAGDGRTILERQISMLGTLASEILIVASAARLPDFTGVTGARAVVDRYPGAGPLGAVVTALASTPADAVFVIAGDMPNVTASLVEALAARHAQGGADITVPESPRGLEPLAAIYGQSATAGLIRALESGDLSLRRAIRGLRLTVLPPAHVAAFGDPAALFRNINTPADLKMQGRA